MTPRPYIMLGGTVAQPTLKLHKERTMTGAEFKAARQSLGFNQTQLAALMGYHGQPAISTIELTEGEIAIRPALLMQAYIDGYRPIDWRRYGKVPEKKEGTPCAP